MSLPFVGFVFLCQIYKRFFGILQSFIVQSVFDRETFIKMYFSVCLLQLCDECSAVYVPFTVWPATSCIIERFCTRFLEEHTLY